MSYDILKIDPYLEPYAEDIELRVSNYLNAKKNILRDMDIRKFASGYEYFGIHPDESGWVYREWAPAADEMYFTGDFCGWDMTKHKMDKLDGGVFEIKLEGKDALKYGDKVQAIVSSNGELLRRVPSYATRVTQDPETLLWCAEVNDTLYDGFEWTDKNFARAASPLIYECHIGMAQDKYDVGSYAEFTEKMLPRIKKLGYNTIQIMAVMEHPYYGSFGYQVSSFFAASSRYGSTSDLKKLINAAHKKGIAVLLDIVHSHAIKNTNEGLSLFDGTEYQYFHEGSRGDHPAWGTKLFNYAKPQVVHFLLSNVRFWMEVYHFDGFRFDGVTSMLYHDHGLGSSFCDYSMYFSPNTDTEAVTYLQLANELIHTINPRALSIAEDMSGMPGVCLPIEAGGLGFDFRLSMGLPDLWIKLIKEYPDESWDMWMLWHELITRRPKEKTIGYAESHDQALVGDKTIMFRLCDANMYTSMSKDSADPVIDRGMALHKMIRLISSTVAGEGYLNFMGNEFGHPEWIDFPREGNGWSYHYCRRQWSLCDNEALKYGELRDFDREMISLLKRERLLSKKAESRWIHDQDKVIVYSKGKMEFAFNFHPTVSFEGYFIPTQDTGAYKVVLSTDEVRFGGHGRVDLSYVYKAEKTEDGRTGFLCYLPQRSAIVFKKI